MKKSNNFCWRKDSCTNRFCPFVHANDSSRNENSHQGHSSQTHLNENQSKRKCRLGNKCENVSCKYTHPQDTPKTIKNFHQTPSSSNYEKMSGRSDKTSNTLNTLHPQELLNAMQLLNSISINQIIEPEQIQSPWQKEESIVIQSHHECIAKLKEEISKITLSDDYTRNFERQQANILVLQGNILELESHIQVFDSVKSRAIRELSTKPKELKNQIFREIYRLRCRLGAFGKRLEIEKYFSSGHRFLIIQGQTGSGKSTQIPQYLADHPRFYGKRIICTQPRKLAAVSLTRRVSFEYSGGFMTNKSLHSSIGYQVGGDKKVGKDCRIEFVTEGIILERIMKGDKNCFKNVGCIVIDEAHERSITCDLLLGSFKKPDPRWNDILIIATSATIDLNLFSSFFNEAPTVEIEGRTFPVDIIYQPVADETEICAAVAQCAFQIHHKCKQSPGDILCFLPGLEDLLNAKSIFENKLKKVNDKKDLLYARVFTLYGKQDPDKQAEVFEKLDSMKTRKIIFATDVAETSITIDGVVFVVDSGVKKEIVFDSQRNISSLKVNSISKSSAIQRAGRSGRTQPGTCYRLYSQDEFESMNVNATPEVLSKPISLAVLTLLEMMVDPIEFDWLSCPSKDAMANAERELTTLGAVDANRKPTKLGHLISTCQQDPKIVKLVYCACLKGLGEAACSVASILTVSNIFFWNGNDRESKAKAIEQRKKFALPEGDIVTMFRVFEEWSDIYHGRKTYVQQLTDNSEQKIAAVNSKKQTSIWCRDNHVNGKAMFMALTTKADLLKQLKKTQIWRKKGAQNKAPTNLEVQELMCSGYFCQSARVFYSKNAAASVEYFSVESEVAGRLDNRSSLKLLDVQPPKWIVYDKIVRLPCTIFPIASVMDETWLKNTYPAFYKMCLQKTESLPTDLIVKSISQVCFRMIVGRNFCNVDSLEKELNCLLTGDANTGQMYLYCAPVRRANVDQIIQVKIDDALTEIKSQVIEEEYLGETRLIVGEGYQVHDVLFQNEFATLYISNVPKDFTKQMLKGFLTRNKENLAGLDITDQGKKYTAIAKFDSKKDAKVAHERLLKEIVIDGVITVSPNFKKSKGIRHSLTSRLKLTWPMAMSKGTANIYFNNPDGANRFVDNVYYIYPEAIVHVCGQTLKGAQMKAYGLRPNILQPPLTYLKLSKYDRRCRFRFDINAIRDMPNAGRLTYKITLKGLGVGVDKYELMTILNLYDPKNVIVEREDVVIPQSGNGLSAEQKVSKLQPLSRFMDPSTETRDFCNKKSGIAGICVFFTSNSVAKEAYDHAKQQYRVLKTDLSQPHHLEIEYTHMVSIHVDLYTFLAQQITEFNKMARFKGINANITPNRDGSKFKVMRFQTNAHSNLDWIQKELDELTRPTKFICPDSHVFSSWTGKHELMLLKNISYIHWDNESHVIWVYGSLGQKEIISKKIEASAATLKALDILDKEIWLNKSVNINGKEGKLISTKCKAFKIFFHNFQGNKMYISGSNESVASLLEFLKKNNYIRDITKINRFKYEEQRECGICYMPPDDSFIMLSYCGHLFCSECIEPMVNMQPPPYPVKCPVCEQFVALHDIRKLAPKESLGKLLEMAVQHFRQANVADIRGCPNPGCIQLLSYDQRIIGSKGGSFLFCDECITTFCIDCSEKVLKPVKSHDNDSCEDIQSGVSHVVNKHVKTIRDTILNLTCPKCGKAFFDFNGCAAVSCEPPCNAKFCGLCLIDCGENAHPHVRTCPENPGDGYFVSEEALNKSHRKMRNNKLRDYMQSLILDSETQRKIIQSIEKDLTDLGMEIPIVSGNLACSSQDSKEVLNTILQHIRTIQDNIFNLSCPNCNTAFFEFDGSAAVNCYSCQTEFCGLCLHFNGENILAHVLRCEKNPHKGNFYVSTHELFKIHAAVRNEKLRSYFQNQIENVEVQKKVISSIRKDLHDLGMDVPVISERQQMRLPDPIRNIHLHAPARRPVADQIRYLQAADLIRHPQIPMQRLAPAQRPVADRIRHPPLQRPNPPRRENNCQIL